MTLSTMLTAQNPSSVQALLTAQKKTHKACGCSISQPQQTADTRILKLFFIPGHPAHSTLTKGPPVLGEGCSFL